MPAFSVPNVDPCHISDSLFLPNQCTNVIEVIFQCVLLMLCLSPRFSALLSGTHTTGSFTMAAMSSSGVSALATLLWCVLSMLCNTTHVKTMSLTTSGLCSIVPSRTLNLLAHSPLPSCLCKSCSLLFTLPL